MRPVFADPKIDLVFRRIFGAEAHKNLLIALLNDLLGLDDAHRIVDVEYLANELVPRVEGRKLSIVDVRCRDVSGTVYVVEMQVLNVEGFEKRLFYNSAKTYTAQLGVGEQYPALNDVVTVAICDFLMWPERDGDAHEIPMCSRWHMTEASSGARRFGQMRFVVLELPKYTGGDHPTTMVERWAWFFREAERLRELPAALSEGAVGEALDVARTWRFTPEEWEAYDRAKVAEQDARGALSLAARVGREEGREEGRAEGRAEGLAAGRAAALLLVLGARGLPVSERERARIVGETDPAVLDRWVQRALSAESVAAIFDPPTG